MKLSGADVIVAGAGPAGAATALLLARAGVDVLLLDRAVFPRSKPCGDCLSVGATAVLRRLGLLDAVLAEPHARLRGWRIAAPDGSSFVATFGTAAAPHAATALHDTALSRCALSVERSVFDALIVAAAIAAGARFEQQAVIDVARGAHGAVTGVRTRAGVHPCAVTVGADGLRSVVAKRLGARARPGGLRTLSLTFHLHVDGCRDTGEMHVGEGVCAGIAPVTGTGMCNVTIVADSARFGRAVASDARAFARAALDSLPLVGDRIDTGALGAATPLASGPFDRPVRQVAFDGAVLAGDAAGYFDPFTGQGVYQALMSAELLAPCIEQALRSADTRAAAFDSYVAARRTMLRGPRLVQRTIESVLRRPALAKRAIRRISRAPAFGRAIVSVTGDVAPVRTLLSPGALLSLLLPTQVPENAA